MVAKFEPTKQQRVQVEALASYGIEQDDITRLTINPTTCRPISTNTLRNVFHGELDVGMTKANAKVAESLFMQAVGVPAVYVADGHKIRGEVHRNIAAAIFWAKTQMGGKRHRV